MKNQAAQITKNSVQEGRLYLAFELSHKHWKLGFSDGSSGRARIRSIEARNFQALGAEIELAKNREDVVVAGTLCVSRAEEGEVVAHRGAEELHVLRNYTDPPAQVTL